MPRTLPRIATRTILFSLWKRQSRIFEWAVQFACSPVLHGKARFEPHRLNFHRQFIRAMFFQVRGSMRVHSCCSCLFLCVFQCFEWLLSNSDELVCWVLILSNFEAKSFEVRRHFFRWAIVDAVSLRKHYDAVEQSKQAARRLLNRSKNTHAPSRFAP